MPEFFRSLIAWILSEYLMPIRILPKRWFLNSGARLFQSLDELVGKVDAVSVSTPTVTHREIGTRFLESGKHVLVEKPIADSVDDARALIDLAQQKGCVLQVGHIERFNPVMSQLEARLDSPKFIESHRLSPFPKRSLDIGVVLDLMIHDLEIILHLVNSPLEHIDAVGIPVLTRREDIANARLRFENGCVANITVSRISPEKMRKIRVFQGDAYLSSGLSGSKRMDLSQGRNGNCPRRGRSRKRRAAEVRVAVLYRMRHSRRTAQGEWSTGRCGIGCCLGNHKID